MSTVDNKYKKHELREHIYVLPAMYIGSCEPTVAETYIYDHASLRMIKKELTYVPGLYKIFDEIVVNAIDQTSRLRMDYAPKDAKQVKNIWVSIDKETGTESVMNDGDGIDIEKHAEHKVWIPELIFGELLTSSNYNQSQEKRTGGLNGVGSKATNIFSKEMIVETVDWRNKKIYKQRFFNNMKEREPAVVKAYAKTPFTRITFTPDYQRFGMKGMTDDTYELFKKRVYDCCATTPSTVTVYFNDVKLDAKTFERYTDLYLGDKSAWPRAYEVSDDGYWEIVATYSEHGVFDQVSFVNGINTIRGGKHVDYISNQIAKNLVDMMAKKKKTATTQHIKANLMVFIKSSIVNPSFDSQSKETLNTPVAKFGSKFEVSDKFMAALYKTGIADRASSLTAFHDNKKAAKTDGKKTSRIIVPKLDDANLAGTKYSEECTLCLTEGDSARTMAIAGLSVVGRDRYGVFPLRGKILNVKDAAVAKISQNEEITNLKKILGLEQGKAYADKSSLRYGKIMILTDQDVDGYHIKGLLFNIFESLWPTLYKMDGFLTAMMTPIIKVFNKSTDESHVFYNESDYEKWKTAKEKSGANAMKGWNMKYYKGLGTSTENEAKEYFSHPKMITYTYSGAPSDEGLNLAFNKKRADDRKDWLMHYERDKVLDYNAKNVPYEE
jgi:DNA topoisomerase-2